MISISRRALLQGALATGLAATASNAGARPARRNVIVLFTDDHGAHTGYLGTAGLRTPHMDALADRGIMFRNAFSSCASCSPSRMALLTGMHCHSNGGWRNVHSPGIGNPEEDYGPDTKFRAIEPVGVHEDIPTLVEILNPLGYATGITDKLHLSPIWKFPFTHRFRAGDSPAAIRKSAKAFFDDCGGRPFYLQVNLGDTHRPFRRGYLDNFDVPPIDLDAIVVPPNLCDTPMMRQDLAEYYRTIQVTDAKIGVWLEALEAAGLAGNTLVIFTGDQGYCYQGAKATAYDAGVRVPFVLHEPGGAQGRVTRKLISHIDIMPTILDYLGIAIPATVQGKSLLPFTSGQEDFPWRKHVFAEHNAHGPGPQEYYPQRAVWDGRFQYVRNLTPEVRYDGDIDAIVGTGFSAEISWVGPADSFPGEQHGKWGNHAYEATIRAKEEYPAQYAYLQHLFQRPAEELYDLHADPGEMNNLVDDPRYAGKLEELRAAVSQWMQDTKDPGKELINTPRRT